MQIVNLFYELARQHKQLKGFKYGKSYEKGAGNEAYPLAWLDDPIAGQSQSDAVIRYSANVDFLGIPKDNADVIAVQASAFLVGLSFKEKIREIKGQTKVNVESFSFVSLRDYYDGDSAGYRFTFILTAPNPSALCVEYFDPSKQLEISKPLPDFNTDNATGCAVFSDKKGLPNFETE